MKNFNKFTTKTLIIQIKALLRKGGLKLKLISFITLAILITITLQNLFTIPLIKDYIEKKIFDVSTTSIERIADFSRHALLERTYENRLNLKESINQMQLNNIEGLLDISIYERNKDNDNVTFDYLAGFTQEIKLDDKLLASLNNSVSDDVTYDNDVISVDNISRNTYRFVKPILYAHKDSTILLGVAILHYDKEEITRVVKKIINLILMVTFFIVLISIIIVYYLGVRFTKPILSITKAATDVSNGNLDIDLKITTNDEIEDLAERFNEMVNGLRERNKMQIFVSDSTMCMIKKDSSHPLILGGEYLTLTFLFSDIRNFTAMSEYKKPNDIVSIINFYLHLQSEIIKENGGDIDKFIGDEIMASFSGTDATTRAIKSAIAIQTMIKKENINREYNGKTVCDVGIGINRGEVLVGNIGSNERMDFTSIGLTVNLASRLCSTAKAKQILIEQKTYDEINADYSAEIKKPITVKGITNPVPIYSIMDKEF